MTCMGCLLLGLLPIKVAVVLIVFGVLWHYLAKRRAESGTGLHGICGTHTNQAAGGAPQGVEKDWTPGCYLNAAPQERYVIRSEHFSYPPSDILIDYLRTMVGGPHGESCYEDVEWIEAMSLKHLEGPDSTGTGESGLRCLPD